jgi:hypothetical protein
MRSISGDSIAAYDRRLQLYPDMISQLLMGLGFGLCYSLPAGTYNDGVLYVIIAVFAAAVLCSLIAGFFGFPPVRHLVMKKQNRQSQDIEDEYNIALN